MVYPSYSLPRDRYRDTRDPNGPGPLRRILTGIAPVLLLYVLYTTVRWLVRGRGPVDGLRNARELLHIEERLGLAWELDVQRMSLPHEWLITLANWYYVAGFLPVIVGAATLAAWRADGAFRWWRRVFMVTMLLALLGSWLYPLTPPRLLPSSDGFVDTLMTHGPTYYGDHEGNSLFNGFGTFPNLVNVYAAMPSMHVAWSVIASGLILATFRERRWIRPIAALHPLLMGISVVITANHYVLDVVIGALVLLVAILGVTLVERRKRAASSELRVAS